MKLDRLAILKEYYKYFYKSKKIECLEKLMILLGSRDDWDLEICVFFKNNLEYPLFKFAICPIQDRNLSLKVGQIFWILEIPKYIDILYWTQISLDSEGGIVKVSYLFCERYKNEKILDFALMYYPNQYQEYRYYNHRFPYNHIENIPRYSYMGLDCIDIVNCRKNFFEKKHDTVYIFFKRWSIFMKSLGTILNISYTLPASLTELDIYVVCFKNQELLDTPKEFSVYFASYWL
jgi:hypothetical protein